MPIKLEHIKSEMIPQGGASWLILISGKENLYVQCVYQSMSFGYRGKLRFKRYKGFHEALEAYLKDIYGV